MVGGQQTSYERENGILKSNNGLQKDGVRNRYAAPIPEVQGTEPNSLGRGITLNDRRKPQGMQADLIVVDQNAHEVEGIVLQEMQKACASQNHHTFPVYDGSKYKNRLAPSRHGVLTEKEFVPRNSLLTDLYEVKHIQTIYNIFFVVLFLLLIHTAVHDLVVEGRWNFGIDLIQWNFQGFTTCFIIWLVMLATTILLFCCFKVWAIQRIQWTKNSLDRKCWDYGWLIVLIVYQSAFLCVPPIKIMETSVHPASSMALLLEQVRLLMKSYAFVRSNVPRALAYKPHQSGDHAESSPCPGFSKFLYFMFAPTLIYKDEYPRTKELRWKFVVRYFMEVIGCVFYLAFIFERYLMPIYCDFGLPNHHNMPLPKMIVVGWLGSMLPCTLILVLVFYCLLHAWMNACAELMRFADRMFYKDWWTASSFAAYYRLWNIVVHDWLYTYVYRDLSEISMPGKRSWQTVTVFIISAVFHEYVLAFTLRFFYPMLLVAFEGSGVFMICWRKDLMPGGNILMWLMLFVGSGLLVCLYGLEWYARVNCPRVLDPVLDFFVPRSWTCSNF